jgi:hypothetical protein
MWVREFKNLVGVHGFSVSLHLRDIAYVFNPVYYTHFFATSTHEFPSFSIFIPEG